MVGSVYNLGGDRCWVVALFSFLFCCCCSIVSLLISGVMVIWYIIIMDYGLWIMGYGSLFILKLF